MRDDDDGDDGLVKMAWVAGGGGDLAGSGHLAGMEIIIIILGSIRRWKLLNPWKSFLIGFLEIGLKYMK